MSAHSDANTFNHVHDVIYFLLKIGGAYLERAIHGIRPRIRSLEVLARRFGRPQVSARQHHKPTPTAKYDLCMEGPRGLRIRAGTTQRDDGEIGSRPNLVSERQVKAPQLKRYLDEGRGRLLDSLWSDIPPVNSTLLAERDRPQRHVAQKTYVKCEPRAGNDPFFMGSRCFQRVSCPPESMSASDGNHPPNDSTGKLCSVRSYSRTQSRSAKSRKFPGK